MSRIGVLLLATTNEAMANRTQRNFVKIFELLSVIFFLTVPLIKSREKVELAVSVIEQSV